MKIINSECLEKAIIALEKELKDLDTQEKLLVLNHVRSRIAKEQQQQSVSDTIGSNPLIMFANKFVKKHKEDLE